MDYMAIWFWVWLLVAAGLYISEMLTVTFFILPFAVGATVAWLANMVGINVFWQWVIFLVVSVIALAACRPLANRMTRGADTKSGVDRLVGSDAIVIDQPAPVGYRRAKVGGEDWNITLEPGLEAYNSDLKVGERLYVMRVEGTGLVVRRYGA